MKADAGPVARCLEAAAGLLARTRYGWLVTDGGGGIGARPMGFLPRSEADDPWLVRFVTDDRSRKVADIGRGGEVAILVQRDPDEAYLRLAGAAVVRPGAVQDGRLWRDAYRVYFPERDDIEHAAFLEIRIRRLDLWMRGVTAEPFGRAPTTLARDAEGAWSVTAPS